MVRISLVGVGGENGNKFFPVVVSGVWVCVCVWGVGGEGGPA